MPGVEYQFATAENLKGKHCNPKYLLKWGSVFLHDITDSMDGTSVRIINEYLLDLLPRT
jgi:hypothetical protein